MQSSPGPSAGSACFVTSVRVAFGDCDPANIVYFPNFYRWLDQATHDLCEAAGFELTAVRRDRQWVGFPLAEAGARFHRPATINDLLRIETRVKEWRPKMFLLEHRILRDERAAGRGLADAVHRRAPRGAGRPACGAAASGRIHRRRSIASSG